MQCPSCGEGNTLIPVEKDHVFTYRCKKLISTVFGYRCMQCHESFMDPLDKAYEERIEAFIVRVNAETSHLSCASCLLVSDCPFRWDLYNTNGDCLWIK